MGALATCASLGPARTSTLRRKHRPSSFPWACQNPARVRVDHVAEGVHHSQRADDKPVQVDARSAQASLGGVLPAHRLADGGACAGAHAALFGGAVRGANAGSIAIVGAGTNAMGDKPQVKDDGCGHNGYDAGTDAVADIALLQESHDAGGGVQAVGATAAEHDGMHLLHKVAGPKQVGLAGARCRAAHVHSGDGALRAEHDGAACGGLQVGGVPHEQTGHVRDGVTHGCPPRGRSFA